MKTFIFTLLILISVPSAWANTSSKNIKSSTDVSRSISSGQSILFHIKTSLKHDDAQICVAYNVIWASINKGLDVKVLIDADAVNTYKFNFFGSDKLGGYKLPTNLRNALATQFSLSFEETPESYGKYIRMLKNKGVKFYINSGMLVVAGIEEKLGETKNLTVDFFTPITFDQMVDLFEESATIVTY